MALSPKEIILGRASLPIISIVHDAILIVWLNNRPFILVLAIIRDLVQ
jgi:hypothetical protein